MIESINLLGADDVRRASVNMLSAAEEIRRAVGHMDESLTRHRMFLDEWLSRLEEVIKKGEKEDGQG